MMGRKLKKQFCKGEGGGGSKSASGGSHLPPYFGLGGGPCPLAELDRGSDFAGTPATLTSYLNSDLNFFKICSPVSKD